MRERKFYFEPLKVKKGKPKKYDEDVYPYARIQKPGLLVFPKIACEFIGIDPTKELVSIRLFADPARRAIGWHLTQTVGTKEDGYRVVKISKTSKEGYAAMVSINSFLNELKKVPAKPGKLKIDRYKDTDMAYTLFYVTIPVDTEGKISPLNSQFHPINRPAPGSEVSV